MNLDEYRVYINRLAESNSDSVYLNSGKDHAVIVLTTIFNKAKKYVHLFAGDLNGGISSKTEYATALLGFLEKGGELQLLLSSFDTNKEPELFNTLRVAKSKNLNVSVKQTNERLLNEDTGTELHFAVADDKMYRAEHDTENFLAVGSFKDENFSQILNAHFKELFESDSAIKVSF
jgi:hypothetical protein